MGRSWWWIGLLLVPGCLLSSDYEKVPADGGSGGTGAGAGGMGAGVGGMGAGAGGSGGAGGGSGGGMALSCPPWQGQAGDDCDPSLLSNKSNCCFMGRDCAEGDCIDGRCTAVMLSGPQTEVLGIATIDNKVVWASGGDGNIRSSDKSPPGPSIVIGNDPNGWATMLTADDAYAYWLEWGASQVWRVNLNGQSNIVTDVGMGAMAGFGHIAVHGDDVFFAMETTGGVWRAKADGSLATPDLVADVTSPTGVASDGQYVYWSDGFVGGSVQRLAIDDIGTMAFSSMVAGNQDRPSVLALDDTHLYWINGNGNINRWPLDGGAPGALTTTTKEPMGLVVDDHYVYWTEKDTGNFETGGALRRVAKRGSGEAEIIVSGHPAQFTHQVGQDCTTLYFDHGDGTLWKVTK